MESRKTAAKNHWEEYMYEYSPEKIKSRVHNHDLHKDSVEEISALEREALDFLKSDCRCYDETDRSYDENLMCLSGSTTSISIPAEPIMTSIIRKKPLKKFFGSLKTNNRSITVRMY